MMRPSCLLMLLVGTPDMQDGDGGVRLARFVSCG